MSSQEDEYYDADGMRQQQYDKADTGPLGRVALQAAGDWALRGLLKPTNAMMPVSVPAALSAAMARVLPKQGIPPAITEYAPKAAQEFVRQLPYHSSKSAVDGALEYADNGDLYEAAKRAGKDMLWYLPKAAQKVTLPIPKPIYDTRYEQRAIRDELGRELTKDDMMYALAGADRPY